jgi:hypothetical protein
MDLNLFSYLKRQIALIKDEPESFLVTLALGWVAANFLTSMWFLVPFSAYVAYKLYSRYA